jgi:iron complex transport system permease protein
MISHHFLAFLFPEMLSPLSSPLFSGTSACLVFLSPFFPAPPWPPQGPFVMQGVFSNPLADPGIIGVSSGSSFGAVICIFFGLTSISMYYMPAFALGGAVFAMGCAVCLTLHDGKIPPMSLLLAGVAVSILLGAMTNGLLTFMNEYRLKEFLFWMVGGLDYRRWEHVELAAGPILTGIIVLSLLGRHLNVLSLGEDEARSMGMNILLYRLIFLLGASLITASAVCVSGMIGFVGLVVPHITRLTIGPDHRILIPLSALVGAFFLLFCDTLGRLIAPPLEIRVGIMTAVIGAPYFLYLIRRMRKGGGV